MIETIIRTFHSEDNCSLDGFYKVQIPDGFEVNYHEMNIALESRKLSPKGSSMN